MPLGTLGYAWGSMHETYGDSKRLIDGGNLGIMQQHESVHQKEGVVAIEGRGEGLEGTKIRNNLRNCNRS